MARIETLTTGKESDGIALVQIAIDSEIVSILARMRWLDPQRAAYTNTEIASAILALLREATNAEL
jgi:hypothetical protein